MKGMRAAVQLARVSIGVVLLVARTATPGTAQAVYLASEPVQRELLLFEELDIVVGASKHEQKVAEAPSAVTIITGDDIRKFGYRTLGDLLRSVRGFFVTYDRGYGYIGVRGFNRPADFGGRILLLLDGHRLNDPLYDTAASGTDFILDVDLIDRVEIIRGPGSSLYGNNAFFAVINVITRSSDEFNGPEVAGSAGTFDTYTARATAGKTFANGVGVVLSGTYYDSNGNPRLHFKEFDTPPTSDGVARHLDSDRSRSAFAGLVFKGFTLEGGYIDREKQNPTAKYGTVFGDPRYTTDDRRGYAELRFDHEFSEAWHLLAKAYYDYYHYTGNYPYDQASPGDPPNVVINRDFNTAEWTGTDLQVSKVILEKHRLTSGAEFRDHFNVRLRNYDVQPRNPIVDQSRTGTVYALFAQDEFQILPDLVMNAGVRWDYYYSFHSTVNPRLALIYSPLEHTTIKALYGTAFRAPNAVEAYYTDNGLTSKVNPNLKPETITSYELVGEQAISDNLRASVSGFYGTIDDLISQKLDPADDLFTYANEDTVTTWGTEVELNAQWSGGVRGRISYAFAHTQDQSTGEPLDNSPEHLAKLNLITPLYQDKAFAGFEVQYTSSRTTFGGTRVDEFVVENVTLYAHKVWRGVGLSGSIYNLSGEKFSDPSASFPYAIQQDGRTFRVKLTYHF